jgi:hypothetical protein
METESSSLHFLHFSFHLIFFLSRFIELRVINHLLPHLYTAQYDETILKILQIVIRTFYPHISTQCKTNRLYSYMCQIENNSFFKSPFSLYCTDPLVCAMQV